MLPSRHAVLLLRPEGEPAENSASMQPACSRGMPCESVLRFMHSNWEHESDHTYRVCGERIDRCVCDMTAILLVMLPGVC